AFQSFKAGHLDYWQETSAKGWATAYDFPAVRDGEIKRQEVKIERTQPMQAFVLNLRRPLFQDRRVRQALNLAFDFETANKNLFYGQYERVGSYFQNSELAAPHEPPKGCELEILNDMKDSVPAEVFTKIHKNPVNKTNADMRNNLRKAVMLLKDAGWQVTNGVLTNVKTGQPMTVEFLLVSSLFERIVQPYLRNLKRLGINGTIRLSAPGLTASSKPPPAASFHMSACPTIGARTWPSTRASGTTTKSASNITATRQWPSKASRRDISTIGRRPAPKAGRPRTTSQPC
ncbi:unnamed protein product, partial [marine sediment metagenome]